MKLLLRVALTKGELLIRGALGATFEISLCELLVRAKAGGSLFSSESANFSARGDLGGSFSFR